MHFYIFKKSESKTLSDLCFLSLHMRKKKKTMDHVKQSAKMYSVSVERGCSELMFNWCSFYLPQTQFSAQPQGATWELTVMKPKLQLNGNPRRRTELRKVKITFAASGAIFLLSFGQNIKLRIIAETT